MKSRYDSVDLFINPDSSYAKYNDLDVRIDQESYDVLRENGIDDMLAKHIAHLFIRDALVTYDDYASYSDTETSEHFEVRLRFLPLPLEHPVVELAERSLETPHHRRLCGGVESRAPDHGSHAHRV